MENGPEHVPAYCGVRSSTKSAFSASQPLQWLISQYPKIISTIFFIPTIVSLITVLSRLSVSLLVRTLTSDLSSVVPTY